MPKPPPADSPMWKVIGAFGQLNVVAFRASGGRIGGAFGKAKILLLHHVGRKSGTKRVSPLIFLADGANLILAASKGGVDKHPAWYHNLMAATEAEVELPGRERRRIRPRVADEQERERLWPRMVEIYKPYADYQTYTTRQIPLVVLEPV